MCFSLEFFLRQQFIPKRLLAAVFVTGPFLSSSVSRLPLSLTGRPDESPAERLDGDFDPASGVPLTGVGRQAGVR